MFPEGTSNEDKTFPQQNSHLGNKICYFFVLKHLLSLSRFLVYGKSLETRREEARLTLLFKLSHNLVNISTDEYLQLSSETRTRGTRGYKYKAHLK